MELRNRYRIHRNPPIHFHYSGYSMKAMRYNSAALAKQLENERQLKDQKYKYFKLRVATPNENGCHLWTGAISANGYGAIRIDNTTQPAHRVAYELAKGSIPDGMLVTHSCDTPLCCNPNHLILGTHSENLQEAYDRKLRLPKGQKGEAHGHSKLTEAQVKEIRSLRETNFAKIAKKYQVTRGAIRKVIKRITWRHI